MVDVALVAGSSLVSMMLAHKPGLHAFTVLRIPWCTDGNEKQKTHK